MSKFVVLSHFQAAEMARAILDRKDVVRASLDLGLTASTVKLDYGKQLVFFPGEEKLTFDEVSRIASTENVCFVVEKGKAAATKIQLFSADTNRFYKLFPTKDAPTAEISGIRMHRVQERSPWEDTEDKIKCVEPLSGLVLDTCCGLGYTAIAAAVSKKVERVYTFERDKNMVLLADYNPWSQPLFNDIKIKLSLDDISTAINYFDSGFFSAIIHDPPRMALSPELYSLEFYQQLHRVLKKGGKLYHYTGSPGEKRGINIARGVVRRLKEAGFANVVERKDVLGVVAVK
ncbi:methyltransferase domain-containing protein [Candidatus Woesearchaeota archaeon]|nr:methyltransferase domain-containing protein [Candidatus Woesearchaeota archaeon]